MLTLLLYLSLMIAGGLIHAWWRLITQDTEE